MLVGNEQELDKIVQKEIKMFSLPKGWKVNFSPSKTPGRGSFCLSGRWNKAKFKYERQINNETYINLRKDGNEIFIYIDEGGIFSVDVNDCNYRNPLNSWCTVEKEPWQERTPDETEQEEALEFAAKAIVGLKDYFKKVINPLFNLIEGYYAGRLLHPEARMMPRSHKNVYDKFDLAP